VPQNGENPASRFSDDVIQIARQAGTVILEYYESGAQVSYKSDASPLTEADTAANDLIVNGLSDLDSFIPIVSEELKMPDFTERSKWPCYWLIDPMDGTKSFIRGDGQFTVNIAMISRGSPVFGVVHSPVEDATYYGIKGAGAMCIRNGEHQAEPISVRKFNGSEVTVISSRSRGQEKVREFMDKLKGGSIASNHLGVSSSIKFCRLAEGAVDILAGFGATSEWDTAAAQCVVECAGGQVQDLTGLPVVYNKRNRINPAFLAVGDSRFNWFDFLPDDIQTWVS